MTAVYIDEVFLLNAVVDYLLLLCSARIAGEPLRRGRLALAAGVGGGYAAAVFLPGCAFLTHPLCQLSAAAVMALAAFGRSRRMLRAGVIFLAVSAAMGGGVLALQLLLGAPAAPDLKTTVLAAGVCYAVLSLVLQRAGRHGGGELERCVLELDGRRCRLTALVDTGNTLTDPATGRPVVVAEGERLRELFPPGACPNAGELAHPAAALERLGGDRRWRLLPYRAVGVPWALLLAVKVDRAVVGEEDYGSVLVALSPTPISDGGGYHALVGA